MLYWNARIFTSVAFQMVGVAVGWQMYSLTGSAFDLGLVGLVQFLPASVLMLVAGQLADRYNRRTHPAALPGGRGLGGGRRWRWASLTGWISKEFILVGGVPDRLPAAPSKPPTMQTLLPAIVPGPLFPRAVAGSASATQAATIAGPALGGVLYAVRPDVVYIICAALFACAALLLIFVQIARVDRMPRGRR